MMMSSGPRANPTATRVITARGLAPIRLRTPPRPTPRSAPPPLPPSACRAIDADEELLASVDDSDDDVIELVSIKARANDAPAAPVIPNALSRDYFATNVLRRGNVARRVIALGLVAAVVIACPWAASFARGVRAQATPHVATAMAPVLAKTAAPAKAVVPAKTAPPAKNAVPKRNATKS